MQPPSRPSRNPLDLAFWGLIVAICVVMGGGIYAMGVRGRPNRLAASLNAPNAGASLAQTSSDGPVRFDGSIETDPSSGPQRPSKPNAKGVSHPAGDLAGIEERLDAIASNLGELKQSVHQKTGNDGAQSLAPTVEFVREFRHLLETGQRNLLPSSTDPEVRRSQRRGDRSANPISDECPTPRDLDATQAFLGEEEPATVTARAQPEIPNTASSSDEVSQPRFEEDEAITSPEEGSEIPTTDEIPQPMDREESNSTDVLQDPDQQRDSTSAIREQDLPTEAQEEDIATESPGLPTETLDPPPSEAGMNNRENSISDTVESDQRSHEQELHDLESDDPEHVARQLPPPTSRSSDPTGPSETRNGNPSGVPSLPTSPDASKETPKTAVRVFYPKHRTVDELAPEIEKHLTPGVGKLTATDNLVNQKARGVGPDTTRRKAIAVKDTPAALQQIAKMLEQSDVAPAPIQEPVADAEFTVDVTAIGVRIDPRQRRGVDLQELSSASGPYTLWAHPTDRVLKCAAGLPNDRNGRLKLAVFHGEEAPLLRDLRDMGPLQAVARSRVTMKSTEASRLVVEQETNGGRRDRARDHSIGVRPVLDAEGTVRLQVLPGTDEQGRPIEQAQQTPEPIGEVELRRGETAVIAGIMQVQPQSSRSRTASSRGRLANEGEVVEWIYLVTPHKQGSVKTSSRSTPARMSSPVAQRLREQRQTVSR